MASPVHACSTENAVCDAVPLLLTLAAVLPLLLSTERGRQFACQLASSLLPGTVTCQGLEIGWFSPTKIRKLRVADVDAHGAEVVLLSIDSIRSESSLITLATGTVDSVRVFFQKDLLIFAAKLLVWGQH